MSTIYKYQDSETAQSTPPAAADVLLMYSAGSKATRKRVDPYTAAPMTRIRKNGVVAKAGCSRNSTKQMMNTSIESA